MPTDTSGVLLRMLALSEDARRQQAMTGEKQIMPRSLMTLLLRTMKLQDSDKSAAWPANCGHLQWCCEAAGLGR
jgi:hypothetical protein